MTWFLNAALYTLIGSLLGVGFVVPPLWWLGLVGVAWCLYLLPYVCTSWKGMLTVGYIWTVKYAFAVACLWTVYPLQWMGFSLGFLELPLIGFYWVTVSVWLGMGGAALAVLYIVAVRFFHQKYLFLLLPLLWMCAEVAGALMFSIMTYGPGGTLGVGFSFGMVGYLLGQHELLLQTASLAGVFGMTIAIVSLAVFGLFLWERQRNVLLGVFGVLLLVSSNISITDTVTHTDEVYTIATVNTEIPRDWWYTATGTIAIRAAQTEAVTAALVTNPDYLILPEDGRFIPQQDEFLQQVFLADLLQGHDTIIVDSGRTQVADQTVQQSVTYDPTSQQVYHSHKNYLVPQGEFLPYFYALFLRITGNGTAVDFLHKQLAYRPYKQTQEVYPNTIPGVLFCFESNHPLGVRSVLQSQPDIPFVAHVVSHGWFHNPQTLWEQLHTMVRVQSLWNGVAVVSVGNHMEGYTATAQGEIVDHETVASGDYWKVTQVTIPIR